MESDPRSAWTLGVSLVEVMLLLVFAALMVYVTDNVESREQEPHQSVDVPKTPDPVLHAKLDAATEENDNLERRIRNMKLFVNELKQMVGAKASTKEGFHEAIEDLKRGYALCLKDNNTLIEASVQNGEEILHVIGDIPSDLVVNLAKGDQTSDLDQIVLFIQDVHRYAREHECRFNYRLKYATDHDYRMARERFERYFYPEKMIRTG